MFERSLVVPRVVCSEASVFYVFISRIIAYKKYKDINKLNLCNDHCEKSLQTDKIF